MSKLSPQAVRNVQRILDDIARRRLEERDRDAVGLFYGADERVSFSSSDAGDSDDSFGAHYLRFIPSSLRRVVLEVAGLDASGSAYFNRGASVPLKGTA